MENTTTDRQRAFISGGEHTCASGDAVIVEGTARVTAVAGARADAWDDCTVEALPGSDVVIYSPGVTVHQHQGARVKNRGGGTVIQVERVSC